MSRHIFLGLVVSLVALFAISGTATAGTDTSNLNVQATVVDAGRITAISNIDFGNYDPTAVAHLDQDNAGSVTVVVTQGAAYNIIIGATRQMAGPGGNLNYELYTDTAGGAPWPSVAPGPGATSTDLTPVVYNIHGRVFAGQNMTAGTYQQDILVTLNF